MINKEKCEHKINEKKLFFQYSLFFQVIYQQAEQTVIIVKSTFALKLTATHEFIFYLF